MTTTTVTFSETVTVTRQEILARLRAGEEDITVGERLAVMFTEARDEARRRGEAAGVRVWDKDRVTVAVTVTAEADL